MMDNYGIINYNPYALDEPEILPARKHWPTPFAANLSCNLDKAGNMDMTVYGRGNDLCDLYARLTLYLAERLDLPVDKLLEAARSLDKAEKQHRKYIGTINRLGRR